VNCTTRVLQVNATKVTLSVRIGTTAKAPIASALLHRNVGSGDPDVTQTTIIS
jgi:hypothetical protein